MSLNIKNEETVRLVRELASELDVSLTVAITDAVACPAGPRRGPSARNRRSTSKRRLPPVGRDGRTDGQGVPEPGFRRAPVRRAGPATMIIDTSVLVGPAGQRADAPAILRADGGGPREAPFIGKLRRAGSGHRWAKGCGPLGPLDAKLPAILRIEIVPFTVEQARIARIAYQQFGRGPGYPARLNMGDCFAMPSARDLGEPLLFKGADFALIRIELVVEPVRSRRLSEVVAAYTAGRAEPRRSPLGCSRSSASSSGRQSPHLFSPAGSPFCIRRPDRSRCGGSQSVPECSGRHAAAKGPADTLPGFASGCAPAGPPDIEGAQPRAQRLSWQQRSPASRPGFTFRSAGADTRI